MMRSAFVLALYAGLCAPCFAALISVTDSVSLTRALEQAQDRDEIVLEAGIYDAPVRVRKSLTLRGLEGAVIDAKGEGTGVLIQAEGVRLEGLEIRNYGKDLYERNAGVLIDDGSKQIHLSQLKISGSGFGIRADHSSDITIDGCEIRGNKKMHVLDRGDGVYFNYVKRAVMRRNKVLFVRDGFYLENAEETESTDNYFAGLQYGIHYMYTRNNEAHHNKARAVIGSYALMSSESLRLIDNESVGAVEFGILLNETDKSVVKNNDVRKTHNRRGKRELDTEGKGLFIYGAGANVIEGNLFEENDIGIGVALGGEGNDISMNRIKNNRLQVRYVGSSSLEWSKEGVGNYWSTYQGWDLNNDGFGDQPYQPNDSLDRLFWLYPQARFLMDSPLIVFLKFISARLELDKDKGVVDSYPLMAEPKRTMTIAENRETATTVARPQ